MKTSLKKIFLCLLSMVMITFTMGVDTFAVSNFSSSIVQADELSQLNNSYPIVMVHGLFGWGNDELFGINYWGGKDSLKNILTEKGYTVYTPTIGSISSNWDRACELYAYIKGGTVDYGYAHALKDGHARFGRTYPGVYAQWGDIDAEGIKKIHLIGHSMGGQTIRVLAQLLENGDQDEIKSNETNISPLFTGNKHWIDSIITIATPHDGSQEDEKQTGIEPLAHDFFAALASNTGILNSDNPCFDFKMDQWGLKKDANESYESYTKRVLGSNIWKNTKDLSIWDLSQEGSAELNSWVKAQSDIYYFSLACVDTHKDVFTQHEVPNLNMNLLLLKSSIFMGQYTNSSPGKVQVDKSWWRNDGIVSVISAIAPHSGSSDKIVYYDSSKNPERGVWNYMGEIDNVDHIQVVGQSDPLYHKYLQNKFIDLASMVTKLPK